jgi:hypothetical protein
MRCTRYEKAVDGSDVTLYEQEAEEREGEEAEDNADMRRLSEMKMRSNVSMGDIERRRGAWSQAIGYYVTVDENLRTMRIFVYLFIYCLSVYLLSICLSIHPCIDALIDPSIS